jgi:uncharacterized membrane protein
MKSAVFFAKTGCFLPFLIILNLFFGLIFFKPLIWLTVGILLIMLFFVNSFLLAKKITSFSSKRNSKVIDVEGEVIKETTKSSRITQE